MTPRASIKAVELDIVWHKGDKREDDIDRSIRIEGRPSERGFWAGMKYIPMTKAEFAEVCDRFSRQIEAEWRENEA